MVTHYGRPVAVTLSIEEHWLTEEGRRAAETASTGEDVAAELDRLRHEIDRSWVG